MSTRIQFPRSRFERRPARRIRRWLLAAAGAWVLGTYVSSGAARAEEMVLEGPHPMLKENAVTVQFLTGSGIGNSFSGRGVGVGYGYMLQGPLWLDLQMNMRLSACGTFGSCTAFTGNTAELMAGAAWRFRTSIPVVPIARANLGLVYLYPNKGSNAMGVAARAGLGLKYYVFDWLGFGVEAALSYGHAYFDDAYPGGHGYAVGDLVLGVELQFL